MFSALVLAMSLPGVELRWEAPPECPSQALLEQQIASLSGNRPAPERPPHVHFVVARQGELWHLAGEISGTADSGHRELSAATCGELADAAVLITAIVLDPSANLVPTPPQPTPPEPPEPVTPEPAAPEPAPIPVAAGPGPAPTPPPRPRRPSALVGLSAGLGLGVLSTPAGVVRLALGVRGERWSAAVVQDVWLPRTLEAAPSAGYGGRFWLWSAALRGCAIVPAGPVEVPLCAALAAGVMSAEGTGDLGVSRQQRAVWAAAIVGPGLRVPLGRRVGLLFSAELLAMLARPRFEISTKGVLCCENPVGGQFTGGLELRLP